MYYNIQLQQQQQKVHNPLHWLYISYKFSVKAWREQQRSRHIALRYLWIQDLRQAGEVDIKRVTTHENPADIYTKLLPAPTLQKHLPQNGLLALLDGEGEEECMYYLKDKKHNNKRSRTLLTMTTKFFGKITTTTCTRPSSSTRSRM